MAAPRLIRRLRRLLLVLLVVLVVGLLALYFLGRGDRRPMARSGSGDQGGPGEDLTAVGEGFDYTLEEEGTTRFRIRGRSYQVDRAEKVYLQQMGLTLYTEAGEVYEVESAQAVFDPGSEEATLQEAVRVRGPLDIEMTTPRLQLTHRGQVVVSQQPVAFRYGEVAEGGAQRLRGELAERLFVLAGDVWMRSLPGRETPFALRSNRLFFDRSRHHVRSDGDVRIAHGTSRLDARRANLWLTENDRQVEFVRAMWEIRGSIPAAEEGGESLTFEADSLSVVFEPDTTEVRKFELEGSARQRAILRSWGPGPLLRRFAGGYLVGSFEGGQMAKMEAFVGVRFAEFDLAEPPGEAPAEEDVGPPDGEEAEGEPGPDEGAAAGEEASPGEPPIEDSSPLGLEPVAIAGDPAREPTRQLRAHRGEALYGPGGSLSEVFLFDAVEYEDPLVTASSNRARVDLGQDQGEFFGQPASLVSPDGEIVAPHLLYTRSSGLLYADGGTRTELRESATGALAGSPLAAGEGPIRVESAEAFLRQSPRAFLFRGDVRAWRGENLLLADELMGDEGESKLEAKGSVRTLWHPEEEAEGEAPPVPLEVKADEMVYQQRQGTLIYRGSVRSVQGERVVTCDLLTVELDENRRAERLIAEGEVLIHDQAGERTLSGDRARYEPGGQVVEVEGEEVVMKDGQGGEVTGKRLVYHFDTGVAEVQGAPDGGATDRGAPEGAGGEG